MQGPSEIPKTRWHGSLLPTPKMVANIAACVAQKTKTKYQRIPILWAMWPTERIRKTAQQLSLWGSRTPSSPKQPIESRNKTNPWKKKFLSKMSQCCQASDRNFPDVVAPTPSQQLELTEIESKFPVWCRGCGQQLELVKWLPPHTPNKWQVAATVKALQNSSKPGENRRPSALCHLSFSDVIWRASQSNPLGSPEWAKELAGCVFPIFKGMPHLLLPMNQGKTPQFCFSSESLMDSKTGWIM